MKRSEINAALKELEAMTEKYRFALPPFCHFTPEEWLSKGHEYDEVRECMLGWDITDSATAAAPCPTSTPRCTRKSCST